MNRFVTFALVLLALAASPTHGSYVPNYNAPIQQVQLSSIPNIESYLNSASPYNGPAYSYSAPVYTPSTAVVVPASAGSSSSSSQQQQVASLVKNSPVQVSGPAYGVNYNQVAAYQNAVSNGYGPVPAITTQPSQLSQVYPGQQNYKAYAEQTQTSRAQLPIIPGPAVAKLWVPQNSYGQQASY